MYIREICLPAIVRLSRNQARRAGAFGEAKPVPKNKIILRLDGRVSECQ